MPGAIVSNQETKGINSAGTVDVARTTDTQQQQKPQCLRGGVHVACPVLTACQVELSWVIRVSVVAVCLLY